MVDTLKQENCPNDLSDLDTMLSNPYRHRESRESTVNPANDRDDDADERDYNHDLPHLRLRSRQNHQRLRERNHHSSTQLPDILEDIDLFKDYDEYNDFKNNHGSNHDRHSGQQGRLEGRYEDHVKEDDRVKHSHSLHIKHEEARETDISGTRLSHETFGELNTTSDSEQLVQSRVNYKRVPRRGDIGIQSLDDRGKRIKL